MIVDDANDAVTGVNLLDDNGNKISEAEVEENDASGVVFGQITVDDIDHAMHPHGMHRVTVNDPRFEIREDSEGRKWLALKEGVSLDHERGGGEVRVTVTAQDFNGERNPNGTLKGFQDSETFTIIVNNENDAPRAGTIGNWWVTVDEDLDAENVSKGQWLTVNLEMDDGDPLTTEYPAFTDRDAGDRLTYSLSGPSWLEINENNGQITNKQGMLPTRGVFNVTVTATDRAGESASASFKLNVALSGTDETSTEDNQDPSINGNGADYREGSGEQRVATVRVTDDDQDIPDHPFAIKTVQIISITNRDNANDPNNVTLQDHDGIATTPMRLWTDDDNDATTGSAGYGAALVLEYGSSSGDTQTYYIYARDTDPRASVNTLTRLNHETVNDLDIVVRVTDGTAGTDLTANNGPGFDKDTINVDIIDVNERPGSQVPHSGYTPSISQMLLFTDTMTAREASAALQEVFNDYFATAVNQSEAAKVVLHINLSDVWSDVDDNLDENDEETFTATSSTSWVSILYGGPGEWRDVNNGPDGENGTTDDLTWGTGGRAVGGAPDDNDIVVVVEIDRTTATGSTGQGDRGSFTLTARDDDGLTTTATVPVIVVDQNLPIGANAVTISGSPREDGTLRANFNANRDPDLAGGSPTGNALVLYTWTQVDENGAAVNIGTTTSNVLHVGTSNELRLTQGQVGNYIKVEVTYYEVFGGQFTSGTDADGQLGIEGGTAVVVDATTSRAVSNTPDDGVGHFTVTAGANTLTASAVIRDGDYANSVVTASIGANTNIVYSWQVSENGIGGWRDVNQTTGVHAETDTNTATLDNLDDGDGKYYRAVATYDADGVDEDTVTDDDDGDTDVMESVYSDPIRIGDVRDIAAGGTPTPGQTVTPAALTPSGSLAPGGTLSISGPGVSSVQWQFESPAPGTAWTDVPGATGDLTLTQAHAGGMVRALVTYESTDPNNPGVTAVVASNAVTIGGTTTSVRPTAVDRHEITASVSGTGHAARGPVAGDGVTSGQTVEVEETVDLASLFQDADTPPAALTFSAAAATTNSGLTNYTAVTNTGRTAILRGDEGVLVLEPNGKLTYVSDQLRGHDGAGIADGEANDGAGNVLRLAITANDRVGDSANTAELSLRINVAPQDIDFSGTGATTGAASTRDIVAADFVATDGSSTGFNLGTAWWDEVTLVEEVSASGDEILAVIDVQDENFSGTTTMPGHSFGMHTVTVDDDRFVITKSGGANARRDSDGDGSTFELRLVKGAKFDFETESDLDGNPTNGKQIVLTFTATDGGGLSTPVPTSTNGYAPIRIIVTINDDTTDNPPRPPANETPGLDDNEGTDPNDTIDNDGDSNDGDVDGGDPTPPPPGMSLGGIIEDFIDNMDQGDQDLLEDFLLTIDDGLDIL